MATIKYSHDLGERYYDITKAAGGAVTKDMELTFEDTLKTKEVVIGLRKMIDRIIKDGTI